MSERRGEHRGEHRGERRVTVAEAAELLGISKDAVRMRVSRGTLEAEKNTEGRMHVWVDVDQGTDQNADRPGVANELVTELRDRVRYIEGQLEAERQAHSEARRLLAAALERIPAIEAPSEPPETLETVETEQERAEPRPDAPGAQEDVHRPWWRRLLGV